MIRRQGGFIPGVRPGISTTNYLSHIINRITLPGSVFLASVAVLPSIASVIWDIPLGFSGISILITVGVALETLSQVDGDSPTAPKLSLQKNTEKACLHGG